MEYSLNTKNSCQTGINEMQCKDQNFSEDEKIEGQGNYTFLSSYKQILV